MKCDVCGKPATVHLTQIINNKIQKVDLCEDCAQEKGVTDPENFSLTDLIGKAAGDVGDEFSITDTSGFKCTKCGCTPQAFKKHGRLGCAECYNALKPVLMPILENMHKGLSHKGKAPAGVAEKVIIKNRLTDLEDDLRRAIDEERYEDAAAYRDEIRTLKEEEANAGKGSQ